MGDATQVQQALEYLPLGKLGRPDPDLLGAPFRFEVYLQSRGARGDRRITDAQTHLGRSPSESYGQRPRWEMQIQIDVAWV